jgi:hypothetical protein
VGPTKLERYAEGVLASLAGFDESVSLERG